MRIQHNITALNSHRNLTNNNSAVGKNLEKLSSGYRINRAGDDAAGLAISEKMRAQITGLETAQKNAQDGVSLIQTAEGALTEVHSMLNRMVELADQSANGTYKDEVDRENLQKEITALKDEIDRISEGTNFNGINLLDGSMGEKTGVKEINLISGSTSAPQTASGEATFSQEITLQAGTDTKDQVLNFKYLDKEGNVKEASVTFKGGAAAKDTAANAATELKKVFGEDYEVTVATDSGKVTIKAKNAGADKTQIFDVEQIDDGTVLTTAPVIGSVTAGRDKAFSVDMSGVTIGTDKNFLEIDGTKYQIVTRGEKADAGVKALYVDSSGALTADSAKQIAAQLKDYGLDVKAEDTNLVIAEGESVGKGGLTLQIGDTADDFNQLQVSVDSMSTEALGIGGIDVSKQDSAKVAVDLIKNAINTVSSTRGDLGALQNRLEHTINNLGVTTENMTAAEARIRDVDMAKEMMTYTKNNILVQASQAMLAQANQLPQGVLQLLQ